jgi:hypothetical protein
VAPVAHVVHLNTESKVYKKVILRSDFIFVTLQGGTSFLHLGKEQNLGPLPVQLCNKDMKVKATNLKYFLPVMI